MNNDQTFRKEALEKLTTQQLGDLLRGEVTRDDYNEEVIRLLLDILEQREADRPVETEVDVHAAWEEFRDQYAKSAKESKSRSSKSPSRWLVRVAAAAAVFGLIVFAAPAAMGAENIFTLIGRWTAEIFEFFTPEGAHAQQEYEFKTDHPGLQQVYDAVAELGVTQPIVPMWLPEELELTELQVKELPQKTYVYAKFDGENKTVAIRIEIHNEVASVQYPKDNKEVEIYEASGNKHYIFPNEGKWIAAWANDNVEQSVYTDYSKEVLLQIIDSIYSED